MVKQILVVLAVAALAGCSPPSGQSADSADPTMAQSADGPPAGGEDAVRAWVQQDTGGNMIGDAELFYGDFSGDGVGDVLA